MADQTFPAYSGFYDSVDNDRVYSADEMNRPYRRIVSNGVFATPQGTPSTDLQVLSASGMGITVKAGEGLFGDKWFELQEDLSITVPANNNVVPRIDSVLVQVDTRASGRIANIVYRTGSPASSPVAPAINQVTGVYEYRVSNIYVAAAVTSITQSKITDLRGSSECPWVTALIIQPDTSTLFAQWNAAFAEYYAQAQEEYEEEEAGRVQDWNDFYATLTQSLTISTNVVMLSSQYVTESPRTTIPLGIVGYNPAIDQLFVFIDGVFQPSNEYTYSSVQNALIFTSTITQNKTVDIICLKSVLAADPTTVNELVQAIETELDARTSDSGWLDATLETGVRPIEMPQYRKVGKTVFIRGSVRTPFPESGNIFCLPDGFFPQSRSSQFLCLTNISATTAEVIVNNLGTVRFAGTVSGSFPAQGGILYLDFCFLVD